MRPLRRKVYIALPLHHRRPGPIGLVLPRRLPSTCGMSSNETSRSGEGTEAAGTVVVGERGGGIEIGLLIDGWGVN